jgi:hypothetical protein
MPTTTKTKTKKTTKTKKKTNTIKPVKPTQDFPGYGYCLFTQDTKMPFKWCGDITIPGSSWCMKHESIVYTGARQDGKSVVARQREST